MSGQSSTPSQSVLGGQGGAGATQNAMAGPSNPPPPPLSSLLGGAGGDGGDMFDPATLANIAALSRLIGDSGEVETEEDGEGDGVGEEKGDGGEDGDLDGDDLSKGLSREKLQDLLATLRAGTGVDTPIETEGEEDGDKQTNGDGEVKENVPQLAKPDQPSSASQPPAPTPAEGAAPSTKPDDPPRGQKRTREEDGDGRSAEPHAGPSWQSATSDKADAKARDNADGQKSDELKVEEDELHEAGDGDAEDTDAQKTGDETDANKAPEKPKKVKSKRNRLVLSCTECHRRKQLVCPIAYWIKKRANRSVTVISPVVDGTFSNIDTATLTSSIRRGVASLCRMEHPVLPQRKKRKVVDASPIKHELSMRVAALEALIRSGSAAELEQAGETLTETVKQATKAAGLGSLQASQALANLSNAAKGDLGPSEQAAMLMNVLQQLAAASSGRTEDGEEVQRDIWGTVPDAVGDTFEAVQIGYDADDDPKKMILTLPGFREDSFAGFIPPTAKYADRVLRRKPDLFATPLPIQGSAEFLEEATKLAYGADTIQYKKKNANSMIGALRIAATFIARFPPIATSRTIYVPNPTLEDHEQVLQDAGLEIELYRYLDEANGGIDWQSIREDLQKAVPGSAVLLFVSGSIPTGADLTPSQWRLLSTIMHERHLIPLCVMSFQGLATGDLAKDAQPVRFMVHEGLPVVLVQDFEATMGLYNDSPGVVSVVCGNHDIRDRVDGQLRSIAKGFDSRPSPWGSAIAHMVLTDPKLSHNWTLEIKAMSDRLRSVRDKLYDTLANKKETPGEWAYIKKATGMFCTAILPQSRVEALTTDRHVHLLPDGSFSLGCLNAIRIESFASSIDYVVREGIKLAEEAHAAAVAMEAALRAAQEAAAREAAEAEERAAREAEEAALAEEERLREEDQRLMEASIANAIEAQRRAEEEAMMQEEERREMDEAIRKAAEKAEIARRAEEILASIGLN